MIITGTAVIDATDQVIVHQDLPDSTFIYTHAENSLTPLGGPPILIRGNAIDRTAFLHRLANAATAAADELLEIR